MPKKCAVAKQVQPASALADPSSGPESADHGGSTKVDMEHPSTGQDKVHAGPSGQSSSGSHQRVTGQFSSGACAFPPDTQDSLFEQISEDDFDWSGSCSGSDDGQLSDSTEPLE